MTTQRTWLGAIAVGPDFFFPPSCRVEQFDLIRWRGSCFHRFIVTIQTLDSLAVFKLQLIQVFA